MSSTHVLTIQEGENGDGYIVIPDDMLEELNWAIGDTLVWSFDPNNILTLRKTIDDPSN
jgi:hypothetical protein